MGSRCYNNYLYIQIRARPRIKTKPKILFILNNVTQTIRTFHGHLDATPVQYGTTTILQRSLCLVDSYILSARFYMNFYPRAVNYSKPMPIWTRPSLGQNYMYNIDVRI